MLTTLKITRIWIEDIDKVEVVEAKKYDELDFGQCEITIWTTKGEKYELILKADTADQLAFKKPEVAEWLTPKVYKGKSMHEEELEGK